MAKISIEVAEQEYKRFIDALDLDEELDKDILENEESKASLIKAIRKTRLLIDEDGTPIINFIYSNKLRSKSNKDIKQLENAEIKTSGELFFALANGSITAESIAICTGLMQNQVKQLDPRDNILITSILGFFISS